MQNIEIIKSSPEHIVLAANLHYNYWNRNCRQTTIHLYKRQNSSEWYFSVFSENDRFSDSGKDETRYFKYINSLPMGEHQTGIAQDSNTQKMANTFYTAIRSSLPSDTIQKIFDLEKSAFIQNIQKAIELRKNTKQSPQSPITFTPHAIYNYQSGLSTDNDTRHSAENLATSYAQAAKRIDVQNISFVDNKTATTCKANECLTKIRYNNNQSTVEILKISDKKILVFAYTNVGNNCYNNLVQGVLEFELNENPINIHESLRLSLMGQQELVANFGIPVPGEKTNYKPNHTFPITMIEQEIRNLVPFPVNNIVAKNKTNTTSTTTKSTSFAYIEILLSLGMMLGAYFYGLSLLTALFIGILSLVAIKSLCFYMLSPSAINRASGSVKGLETSLQTTNLEDTKNITWVPMYKSKAKNLPSREKEEVVISNPKLRLPRI